MSSSHSERVDQDCHASVPAYIIIIIIIITELSYTTQTSKNPGSET